MTKELERQEHYAGNNFRCSCGFTTDFIKVMCYHIDHPDEEVTINGFHNIVGDLQ